MDSTEFFGSQIGCEDVINYSYTDMPWTLLVHDIYSFLTLAWATPYIMFPLSPCDSADLDELARTLPNAFCILIHLLLGLLQLGFFLALPFAVLFPVWTVVLAVALFLLVNRGLCAFLDGPGTVYHSDPEYAAVRPEHAHEQWIFLNGVAVGNGILFDIVECLVQRNLGYATTDVRVGYAIVKEKLYSPQYAKVVFILHSQGAIEGGMILDWLLQELPQDLTRKLEVYTFGNAANHFNNPHRSASSQARALRHPALASVDACFAEPDAFANGARHLSSSPERLPGASHDDDNDGNSDADGSKGRSNGDNLGPTPTADAGQTGPRPMSPGGYRQSLRSETWSTEPAAVSDRAVGHIEHYAHTTDFVALWGVLRFATSERATRAIPRFMGRVFARTSRRGGHQFCQHYLDGMFPLVRDPTTGRLARDKATGAYVGCAEEEGENEFMESEVLVGGDGDEMWDAEGARKELGFGWWDGAGADPGEVVGREEGPVKVHPAGSGVLERWRRRSRGERGRSRDGAERRHSRGTVMVRVKVKDLSRLWQYRNGRSPNEISLGPVKEKGVQGNVADRIATL